MNCTSICTSVLRTTIVLAAMLALAAGCTVDPPATPDGGPVRVDSGPPGDDAQVPDANVDAGPPPECTPEGMGATIGDACDRDADCNDGCFCNGAEVCMAGTCAVGRSACGTTAECGAVSCAEATGCVYTGDDTLCDDGDPCNGAERCEPRTGCRASAPPSCNDASSCTIDACEPGVGCVYEVFDGDGDGDAARTCGGGDCNDADPDVVSTADEICGNGLDDNCNGQIDIEEAVCRPTNDGCADALDVTPAALGTFRYQGTTMGFETDATLPCGTSASDTRADAVDAVFSFTLDQTRDVTISVEGMGYNAALLLRDLATCDAGPNLKCIAPSTSTVEPVLHRRRLPAGSYAVIVKTRTEANFTLALTVAEASVAQSDICLPGDTLDISAGGSFAGSLEDHDYQLSCHSGTSAYREAAHRLVIPAGEFRDVRLAASVRSATGTSTPYLELTTACGDATPTFGECTSGSSSVPGELFIRGLPGGTYWVLVENSVATAGSGSYTLNAEILPSAGREPGDSCDPNVPVPVTETTAGTFDLATFDEATDTGAFCGANRTGYRDGFFTFTLTEPRDVVVRTTSTARHWVGLSSACGTVTSPLDCMASAGGVAERRFLRVPAGTHFLNVSTLAAEGTVSASFTTFPPTPVPGNDVCTAPTPLVDGTSTVVDLSLYTDTADYACGAPDSFDAYYTFTLADRRFVTLIAEGASSMALVTSCGGAGTPCVTSPPQVTQELDPGTYIVAIESAPLSAGPVTVRFATIPPSSP